MFAFGSGAFAVVSFGYALYTYRRATRASSWPTTEGIIKHVSIKYAGAGLPASDAPGSPPTEWFLPVVEFSYVVHGRTYAGSRFFIGDPLSSMPHEAALWIVKPYREGMKVRVHYNPASPAEAVLDPGADNSSMTKYIMVGIAWMLLSIYYGFF